MRPLALALALVFPALVSAIDVNPAAQGTGKTTEVLVLNATPTLVPATPLTGRRWVEVQNLGPNPIFCSVDGSTPVLTKSRSILAAASWAMEAGANTAIKCLAGTADQATGAATIVTELR